VALLPEQGSPVTTFAISARPARRFTKSSATAFDHRLSRFAGGASKTFRLLTKATADLKKWRENLKDAPAVPAAVLDDSNEPTDANPNHREDFNSLLGAAVKPRG
jgi:hypothetical protein